MSAIWEQVAAVFRAGGWVMWPLLAMSFLSATLSAERSLFWLRTAGAGRNRWVRLATDSLRRGEADAARRMAEDDRSVFGRVARDVAAAQSGLRLTEGAVHDAVESVRPRIERFAVTLSTIVTAAPMLGILGTVVGIIDSFKILAQTRAGAAAASTAIDPASVAGGIAQALYTTAFGLLIAIATLFPYVMFRSATNRCLTRLEGIGVAALEGQGDRKAERSTPPIP